MEIRKLTLFQNLSDEEMENSLECSQSRTETYGKNEYIFQQEEEPQRLYFVLEGTVELGQINEMGRLNNIEYLAEGQSFGEIELFLGKNRYTCYAKAQTPIKVLSVSRHFFYGSCPKNCVHHCKVVFNMLHIFAEQAEKSNQKIQLLSSGSLRQRILDYLIQISGGKEKVKLPMKREELAAYLNTTRPSLSRELSRMQEEGIIELVDRNHIKVRE